jgi:hypothetical protein
MQTPPESEKRTGTGRRWVILSIVLLAALALRLHHVSHIFLWEDETDIFNARLFSNPPQPLLDFAWSTQKFTTYNWGWPAIIWLACHTFGASIGVARIPSVLAGTLGVLLVSLLTWRVLPEDFGGRRFLPAIFAAILAAIAVPQMEFSQRVYPYEATACMAAALFLAHLGARRALVAGKIRDRRFAAALAAYTVAGSAAMILHASLVLPLAISGGFLAIPAIGAFRRASRGDRARLLWLASAAGVVFLGVAYLTERNPQSGYRGYLAPYYGPSSLRAIPTLLAHTYDLATYHLNLFYNSSLYWPLHLNIVLLPLVAICLLGWGLALAGRYGGDAGHIARLALGAVAICALLSTSKIRMFPFGGVRQTMFLSPLLFLFTALGFYAFRPKRISRAAGGLAAALYFAAWAYNLPLFYGDRLAVFDTADLVQVWRDNGRLPFHPWIDESETRYLLKDHPEIPIQQWSYAGLPPRTSSYLLLTRWAPVDYAPLFPDILKHYRENGQSVDLLLARLPKHPDDQSCHQCIYAPPNGLWIYKIAPLNPASGQ